MLSIIWLIIEQIKSVATSNVILKFGRVQLSFRNTFGRVLNGSLLVFFDDSLSSDDGGDIFSSYRTCFVLYDGERCCLEPRTLSTADVARLSNCNVEGFKPGIAPEVSLLESLAW